MSRWLWPAAALAFGAATIVVYFSFAGLNHIASVYPNNSHGQAVIAFQFANGKDLVSLFPRGDVGAARLDAMDAINKRDLYAFIPSYALFGVCLARALGGSWRRGLVMAAVAAISLAAVADVIETTTQLQVTQLIRAGSDRTAHVQRIVPMAATAKWLSVCAALAINGVMIFHRRSPAQGASP